MHCATKIGDLVAFGYAHKLRYREVEAIRESDLRDEFADQLRAGGT